MSMYHSYGAFDDFTKEDWYGYAGAERFNDNSEPKISHAAYCGWDSDIIADKNGIQVFSWRDNPDEPSTCYIISLNLPKDAMVAVARTIANGISDACSTHEMSGLHNWMVENYPYASREEC